MKPYKVKNPATGKYYPEWHFRYTDETGRLRSKKGYRDKAATLERQEQLQREADRKAHLLATGQAVISDRPLKDLVSEYLDFKVARGGHHGRPWSPPYAEKVEARLAWWLEVLPTKTLMGLRKADIERPLLAKFRAGMHGNSLNQYASALHAFLDWCVEHDLIPVTPMRNWKWFAFDTRRPRRDLKPAELEALFRSVTPEKALAYQVTLLTGMRSQEICNLRVSHVDWEKGAILLPAAMEKNRRGFIFALPAPVMESLRQLCAEKAPDDYLFDGIGRGNPARALRRDLKRAGFEPTTSEGTIGFHSLRITYITLLARSGADPKTVQTLARHQDPRLTFNVYAKASPVLMRDTVTRLLPVLPPTPSLNSGEKIRQKSVKNVGGFAGTLDSIGPYASVSGLGKKFPGPNEAPAQSQAQDEQTRARGILPDFPVLPPGLVVPAHDAAAPAHVDPSKIRQKVSAILKQLGPAWTAHWLEYGERLVANAKQAAALRPARKERA